MRLTAFALLTPAIFATQLPATTLTLPLSAYGQATAPDSSPFTIQPNVDPLNTVYIESTNYEQRAILEFNLASLPAGTTIDSADLNLYVSSTGIHQGLYPSIRFYGYAGNNSIEVADAHQDNDANALATEMINDTGPWPISLDPSLVQSFINAHAPAIGVMTYDQSEGVTVGIRSVSDGGAVFAPTITLTYSSGAPLPGDANSDGRISPDDYALTDRGFSQHLTGWQNGDFNNDNTVDQNDYLLLDQSFASAGGTFSPTLLSERQSQFGDAYVSELLTTVPEPSSLLACVFAGSLLRRHRVASN